MKKLIVFVLLIISSSISLTSEADHLPGHNGDDPLCVWPVFWDDHCGDPQIDPPPPQDDDEQEYVIDTLEVTSMTLNAAMSCLDWELRGICIWMTCFLVVCEFDTSLKVKNHTPDLLVQAYNRNEGEPWKESQDIIELLSLDHDSSMVRSIMNAAAGIMDNDYNINSSLDVAGGQRSTAKETQKSSLSFYYVDAFGNPGLLAFDTLARSSFGLICSSNTTPFTLHYNSNLDSAAWRWNIPELFYPQSWLVGTDALGGLSNNWGPIYPRMAFNVAQDPLKSAVLKAFRVAHFVTGNSAARIFVELDHSSQDGYWPYGPLDQNDGNTGKWQMLYPKEDDSCQQFPYNATSTHEDRRSDDYNYVWNFWKAYKCCERKGSNLIFHTG